MLVSHLRSFTFGSIIITMVIIIVIVLIIIVIIIIIIVIIVIIVLDIVITEATLWIIVIKLILIEGSNLVGTVVMEYKDRNQLAMINNCLLLDLMVLLLKYFQF